ncbi:MAG: carboxypeptidase-like regulatory domain-containing protein [Candidatus Thorarchaeota archaeon]
MRIKNMRMDHRGSIEGLPLQLLIAVVVSGIVLTIILGWLASIEPPKSIRSIQVTDGKEQVDSIEFDSETGDVFPERITVVVYDQDMNPLEGALVYAHGCGVSEYKTTNEDGEARIDVSDALLPDGGLPIGHMDILVEKSGYVKSERTFPIVRV